MEAIYQRFQAMFGPGPAAFYAMRDGADVIHIAIVGQDGGKGQLRVPADGVDEIVAALMAAKISKPLPEEKPRVARGRAREHNEPK